MRRRMLLGADAGGGDTLVPPNNEIWFIASSDYYIQNPPNSRDLVDAKFVSTVYKDGKGIWKYDADVVDLGGTDAGGPLSGMDGIYSVVLPKTAQMWTDGTFFYSGIVNLVIQETITKVYSLYQFKNIYIKATIPPLTDGAIMGASQKIYVPTESVYAYKNAAGWNTYASQIYGYDFKNNDLWSDIQKK